MEGHPPDLRLRYWQAVLLAAERMQAVKAVRNQAVHMPVAAAVGMKAVPAERMLAAVP